MVVQLGKMEVDMASKSILKAAAALLVLALAAGVADARSVKWARSGDAPADQAWRDRYVLAERWQPPRFPLGGADVVALGVPPGPRVGELLRALEAWWIADDFAADETALRAQLQQMIAQG